MTFCPYCGTEIDSEDIECPNCHAPIKDAPKKRYCSGCGSELADEALFCPKCGTRTGSAPKKERPRNGVGEEITAERSALIGIILSFILPGLGSIYAGYMKDGFILIALAIICGVLGFFFFFPWIVNIVIWLYGMYDAYRKCEDNNRLWYQYIDSQ